MNPDSSDDLNQYFDSCRVIVKEGLEKVLGNGIKDQLTGVDGLKNSLSYLKQCNGKKNESIDGQLLQMVSDDDEKFGNLLQEVFKLKHDANFFSNLRHLVKSFQGEASNADKLFGFLLQPRYLKTCLDIVLENFTGNQLKITEASAVTGEMYK